MCSPLWSVFCAQRWRRGSEGVSSPGQTMRGWTAAVATKEPLGRGTVYLVSGLTLGPLAAGTDADPTRGTGFLPSVVRSGPRVFANSLIDFSNIRLLALALEKLKGALAGQRRAASGGLAPHTHVQAVWLIFFASFRRKRSVSSF